jgi:hypothetical protein
MWLFPARAAAASRDPDVTAGYQWEQLYPSSDCIAIRALGLAFDQWIDPADIGYRIRFMRAHGGTWHGIAAAAFPDPIPVFVIRCWALEHMIRSRRTLRQIRRDELSAR